MAIAVMLNNFFHDFAVAMLACSLLSIWLCCGERLGLALEARRKVHAYFSRIAAGAWAWIVVGGAVRSWAYLDYEWLPAAGRGQVAALVLKHLLLVALVVLGVRMQWSLGRRLKEG